MARVVWTDEAWNDLHEIASFIARDSPHYARVTAERFIDAARRLADQPRLGQMIPRFERDDVRRLVVGNYQLVYRIIGDAVEIVTLYHSARNIDLADLL